MLFQYGWLQRNAVFVILHFTDATLLPKMLHLKKQVKGTDYFLKTNFFLFFFHQPPRKARRGEGWKARRREGSPPSPLFAFLPLLRRGPGGGRSSRRAIIHRFFLHHHHLHSLIYLTIIVKVLIRESCNLTCRM
jgi:hypothetical protein